MKLHPPDGKLNVLLPVETMSREFDARLLVAVAFASPDRRIFVGQHNALDTLVPKMRGGIYVGKNVWKTLFPDCDQRHLRLLKAQGFSVLHLDEEGGFYTGGEEGWRDMLDRRLDPRVLGDEDAVCTWGEWQANYYRGRSADASGPKVVATGHPRFDLYHPRFRDFFAKDVDALNARFGRYALVNTNMSLANSSYGRYFALERAARESADDPGWRCSLVGAWSAQVRALAAFVRLVHRLDEAVDDGLRIVVRPHPAEDHCFYEKAFDGLTSVVVVREGSVAPWILGSEVVVHDGCTTAIEATLAGKPVVLFREDPLGPHDQQVLGRVGRLCSTVEEAVEAIAGAARGENLDAPDVPTAKALLSNLERPSLEPLLEVMGRAETLTKGARMSPVPESIRPQEVFRTAKVAAKSVLRPLFRERHRRFMADRARFPGFERRKVEERIARLETLLERRVRVRMLSSSVFVVEAD